MSKSKVYFTKEITPKSLIKIYEALNTELKGKVAVKISTGEAGGHNFLDSNLIKDLVSKLNGTIVECNTVDCDCNANPAEPEMDDIGIFASLDPVAVDQACVDAVVNSSDKGKASLIERMESRNGYLTLEAASKLGLGSREYELIEIN